MRINFELNDLRAFLAVLDLEGFHRAADHLGMSQPAISRRIQQLEQTVGAPLLERTTRRVAPTTVGASFAPLARRLLDDFEDSLLSMTGLGERQGGQITLACVPTATFYFLPRAIERFNAIYPHIRFRILDLSSNDGLQSVSRGEAEFGINLAGGSEADLTFTPIIEDPFVLACRRDHPLAHEEQLDWRQLQGHTLIGAPPIKRTIGLVERRTARLSPAAQRFHDMLLATWKA